LKIGYRKADLVIAGGGVAGFCAAIGHRLAKPSYRPGQGGPCQLLRHGDAPDGGCPGKDPGGRSQGDGPETKGNLQQVLACRTVIIQLQGAEGA